MDGAPYSYLQSYSKITFMVSEFLLSHEADFADFLNSALDPNPLKLQENDFICMDLL